VLVVLSVPFSDGLVFRGFLRHFTETLGSPIWLAVWLQLAFFAWAWLRGTRGAERGALATLALLTVVGPQTLGLRTLTEPQAWPAFTIGALLLIAGLRSRSSRTCTLACAVVTAGAWLVLPATLPAAYRMATCYHLLWAAVIVLGLALRDRFAETLRIIGALQMPLASIVVMTSPAAADVPMSWRLAYVVVLTVACLAIATAWRSRWYLYAFTSLLAVGGYGAAVLGFRGGAQVLGRPAMTSFLWSGAALLLGILISAHKARWLPSRLFPRWGNGAAKLENGHA
jgi:hypothetical protein